MGADPGYYAHWHLPKSGITMLCKALVTGLISVQTLSVRIRDITCDRGVVTDVSHHIGPNQASRFQCRFTSKKQHFVCYPTHVISNAKQAQTQRFSTSVSCCFEALSKSAALLQAAACGQYLIPALYTWQSLTLCSVLHLHSMGTPCSGRGSCHCWVPLGRCYMAWRDGGLPEVIMKRC